VAGGVRHRDSSEGSDDLQVVARDLSGGDVLTEEGGEPVEQQAGAVLALRRILEVVEERAVLGEDEPRAVAPCSVKTSRVPSPSGRTSTVVSDTEMSRPSSRRS
jgi:hypothetical protein